MKQQNLKLMCLEHLTKMLNCQFPDNNIEVIEDKNIEGKFIISSKDKMINLNLSIFVENNKLQIALNNSTKDQEKSFIDKMKYYLSNLSPIITSIEDITMLLGRDCDLPIILHTLFCIFKSFKGQTS